jgi:hypothetical protein
MFIIHLPRTMHVGDSKEGPLYGEKARITWRDAQTLIIERKGQPEDTRRIVQTIFGAERTTLICTNQDGSDDLKKINDLAALTGWHTGILRIKGQDGDGLTVFCRTPGLHPNEWAYAVCPCVLRGEPVEAISHEEPAAILCGRHHNPRWPELGLPMVCAACAAGQGILQVGGQIQTPIIQSLPQFVRAQS